jgi:cytochrome c-type biogenesis protein
MTTETATPTAPAANGRLRVFLHALLFVLGFSLVFVIGWGGSVTVLGQFFGAYKRVIAQIGGIVVIMFGLATLEVIRIPWFYADTRAQFTGQKGTYGGALLMGLFFAAGFHPQPLFNLEDGSPTFNVRL